MWKNSYIDDIGKESNAWSDIGTFLHEIMESTANGEMDYPYAVIAFDNHYDKRVPEFPKFSINLKNTIKRSVDRFLASLRGLNMKLKALNYTLNINCLTIAYFKAILI